jgi:iron complex outermembrane receptor protein
LCPLINKKGLFALGFLIWANTGVFAHAELVIEEIVVTAQKREARSQTVPITMQAFTGSQLKERRIEQLTDIARLGSNFNISKQSPGTEAFNIRGVGTNDSFANASGSVGVYLDEVTLGAPYLTDLVVFDVERVEVLRGPQNALFGRNTTGGAVSLISRQPIVGGDRDGYLDVSAGNYGLMDLTAAATFSPSESFAWRIAGKSYERDGVFNNLADSGAEFGEIDRKALRTTFMWDVSEATSVFGSVQWGRERSQSTPYRFVGLRGADGSANLFSVPHPVTGVVPGPVPAVSGEVDWTAISGGTNAAGQVVDTGNWGDVFHVTDDRLNADFVGANLRIDHEMGNLLLTSISAWTDSEYQFSLDYGGVSGIFGGTILPPAGGPDDLVGVHSQDHKQEAFSQELRLTGSEDTAFRWIVGGLYYSESSKHSQNIGFGPLSFSAATPAPKSPTVPPFTNPPGLMLPPAQPVGGSMGFLALIGPQSGGYSNQAGFSIADLENDVVSIYAHAVWDFAENLTLDMGLRYTRDTKKAPSILSGNMDTAAMTRTTFRSRGLVEQQLPGLPACDFNGDGNPPVRDAATNIIFAPGDDNRGRPCVQQLARDDLEFNDFGGQLVLKWQPNDAVMMYGGYSRGFRSGKFDIEFFHGPHTGFPIEDQREETLDSLEFGVKSDLLGGSLRLNAAAFYYKWHDQQLFLVNPRTGPTFINLDISKLYGFEVEARWAPADGWLVDASIGLLDSEVEDKGNDPAGLVEQGHELPFAADHSANLAVSRELQVGYGTLRIMVDVLYRSESANSVFTSPTTDTYDEYKQLNMSAAYTFGAEHQYRIGVWGQNLTDEEYCGFELDTFAFTGVALCLPDEGEPLYGIEFGMRF